MPTINDNLDAFTTALAQNISIECDAEGNWTQESTCHKVTRLLSSTAYQDKHLTNIAKAFNDVLDQLEKSPVIFQNDMRITQPQYRNFLRYFNAYSVIEHKLKQSKSSEISTELAKLNQRIVGLKYRIEAIHGGLDKTTTINEDTFNYICNFASSWKAKQKLYPNQHKKLSERDIQKLKNTCAYPEFAKLLLTDKTLRQTFFTWAIRDNNGVEQFIEFPATSQRIRNCLLDKRFGHLAPQELNIVHQKVNADKGYQKIICLPFYDGRETNRISILDESRIVTLNGNRKQAIQEILDTFSRKKTSPGNVEFFSTQGITNWANYELGSWNKESKSYTRIDLSKHEWWTQLPILKKFTKAEIENFYNIKLKDGEWIRSIASTRESLDHDVLKRHGYMEVTIPQADGTYACYPFGKFAKNYPHRTYQKARLITQTVEGAISYPDENTFYSHRQHAKHFKVISPEQGKEIMEHIRKDMAKAITGNLCFQLSNENCAQWVEKTIKTAEGKDAPTPFGMPMVKFKKGNKMIDKLINAPETTQTNVMKAFQFFSYIDGRTVTEDGQRVYKTTFFPSKAHEIILCQPGHLNDQIEQGALPGVITYGN